MRRPGIVGLWVVAALSAATSPAAAQLPLPQLPVGGVVETTTSVAGGVVSNPTGTVEQAVTDVTAALGGAAGDPSGTVGQTIEQVLTTVGGGGGGTGGGSTGGGTSGGGTVPATVLDALLGQLLPAPSATSTTGGSAPGSTLVGSTGAALTSAGDVTAPTVVLRVVSKVGAAARKGVLKVRVTADEAGVVAFDGRLRAGKARKVRGKALKVSRALLRSKPIVLAFSRAGAVTVKLALPKKARGIMRKVRTARVSLTAWATDVSRNQTATTVKKTIKR